MTTRVVGYVRVSTEEQAREGVSLEGQRARLVAFAAAMDLELVAVQEDAGVSAKTVAKRPGLRAALAALEAGQADGLVVVKLDRLTRSLADLAMLLDRYFATRFSLHSVGDSIDTRTAGGRLVLNVLGSVAQWEREAIGERTREAMKVLRSKGVRLGGVGLGVRRGERGQDGRMAWEEDTEERTTVARMVELRAAGASIRSICSTLQAEGRPSKRGGPWRPSTVAKVLARVLPATEAGLAGKRGDAGALAGALRTVLERPPARRAGRVAA